ncbi:hypothetical protein BCR35DRAFT_89517 [Leucosporidium creatinivorum]|uniref:Uncharacterized protein n=1 Tax=Leucosporidium creatinivorum TaxID=106004 RepID=A0A1Y2FBI9_9BASI|nr:hypothetical protein BCR35DRAFT_89517 [Leucosporidium creatinivorum]
MQDLLDASATFNPADFDPLAEPFQTAFRTPYECPVVQTQQQQQGQAPDSPFTAALGGSGTIARDPQPQPQQQPNDLLIDLSAPTPRPPKPFLLARSRLAPPSYAPIRNPSPLKQVFDLEAEVASEDEEGKGAPSDELGTVRKVGAGEWEGGEEEGTPVKSRSASGRRWSVMQKKEEEGLRTARKEGSGRVSPVKEMSPARFDADSSGFLLPLPSDSDCSLLMNEGGSFLLNGSHDAETTLDSFGPSGGFGNLSGIGEEEEDEAGDDRDMANLLNGLSDSCIGGRPPQENISSILPSSLTSSTRHALSKSQNGRPVADSLSASTSSSVTIMDNEEHERSLLACSTASYRTHRDSPARPRMVSIQAEKIEEEGEKTPMKGRISLGNGSEGGDLSGESRRSSGASSSGDVRDLLKGWSGRGDLSMTDLYAQQPPSPINDTSVVATATFELGLISPILPDKISTLSLPLPDSPAHIVPTALPLAREQSPTDLMDLTEAPAPEVVQPPPAMVRSASANGLKRLQEKMDAIRARTAAPLTSAIPAIDSNPTVFRSAPLPSTAASASFEATPRRPQQQQPPARSLLDATPLAPSSSTATARRPPHSHSRQNSIPILEDPEPIFNPHRHAQPTTSPRAEALNEFMDAVTTPAPRLARSGGMDMPKPVPMEKEKTAMATPMARRPRTSLLPSASARKVGAAPSSKKEKENGAPVPVPPSARKEATREKLDRLKEERRRREEGGRSPLKSLASGGAGGLKRPTSTSTTSSSSRLPPPSSSAPPGAAATAAPRPRLPLASRTAPTPSSSTTTRPSLAEALSRKPSTATSTRMAFKPTVPRPAASSSALVVVGGGVGAKARGSLAESTGLRRPATTTSMGVPGVGAGAVAGSRIGKPAPAGGAPGGGGSRIGVLGARNGAK